MTTTPAPLRQSPAEFARDAAAWSRERLFNSRGNTVVSIVLIAFLAWATYALGKWILIDASWEVVRANRRLLLIGRFPLGEEWRIWPVLYATTILIAWSWGAWGHISRTALLTFALIAVLILPTLAGWDGTLTLVPVTVLATLAYLIAHRASRSPILQTRAQLLAVAGWIVTIPLALILLNVAGGVEPSLWGGLYLNFVVSTGAIVGALPLGIALALARTSSFRALRLAATAYIELMRGLPLPVMLVLAWLALRSFLPAWGGIDEIALVYRVTIAFALFTGAYLAEAIRGGLSAIPRGQREAAQALGLSWVQVTFFITMPQAIRNSLPALAGEFIGLFMTTTLIAVVGLTDMLQAARATTEQPPFFGRQKEVLLFIGLLFWVTAFALSRLASRFESALAGKGTRRA